MKKFLFIFVLAVFLAAGTAFADHPDGLGIGIVGFWPGGGGLSLKIPSVPVYWAVSAGFGTDYFSVNITGDYYLLDNQLVKTLHWFLGVGGWFSFYNYSNSYQKVDYSYTHLAFGARIPVGLSFQPVPLLEIFLDIAPSLGLGITGESKIKVNGQDYTAQKGEIGFAFYWPIELGIRLWF